VEFTPEESLRIVPAKRTIRSRDPAGCTGTAQ
jgi:hypothetical protein